MIELDDFKPGERYTFLRQPLVEGTARIEIEPSGNFQNVIVNRQHIATYSSQQSAMEHMAYVVQELKKRYL